MSSSPTPADGPQSYTADWASVDRHPPAPEWFQDAKFGIYFHWGAYTVPAFANEWYPRNMYHEGSAENVHHREVYGDPAAWPYHNFIDGGRDLAGNWAQFAPRLVSDGGNWDPEAWAQLFADAGAKFAGPAAEHHDGYSLWASDVNEWNSVDRGPRIDMLRVHADAIRATGMKLFVAMHHAYNINGFFEWAPPQQDESLRKLYGQLDTAAAGELWMAKLREVVDGYQPDIIWQDFTLEEVPEQRRLEFLAYYYNRALDWGREVVTTYKDGFNDRGAVYDFERGGPAALQTPYWLTDDSISSSSWCYTDGIGYYSVRAMVHALVDRVSKGGTMVLNVAPTVDGTIPSGQQDVLRGIGDYLRRFGESVYATRAFATHGEGPTAMGGGSFVDQHEGTGQDVRFTRDFNDTVLYATVLGWPVGGALSVASLGADRIDLSTLTSVRLLGPEPGRHVDLPAPTQDGAGLHVSLSTAPPFEAPAYVLKLTFAGRIPAWVEAP